MKFGYVPGTIRHYYHGSRKNRKYLERWPILVKHLYDPYKFIKHDPIGLLVPNMDHCPGKLLVDIYSYFIGRCEDE